MGVRKIDPVLDGIEFSVTHFAGRTMRDKVFWGKTLEEVSAYDPVTRARWIKGAMERLDALVDEGTRKKLMQYCGAMCAGAVGRKFIEEAIERLKRYRTVDDFLRAEGVTRVGDVLYTYYQPYKDGKRCLCLGNDLPDDETMSSTYCYCSAGHVRAYWSEVLERPVEVELLQSTLSGSGECKFAVHLIDQGSVEYRCKVCGATYTTAKDLEEHEVASRR